MSTPVRRNGFSGWGKGQTAEVFLLSRAEDAGPSEKIRRAVTKVERYHSLSLGLVAR